MESLLDYQNKHTIYSPDLIRVHSELLAEEFSVAHNSSWRSPHLSISCIAWCNTRGLPLWQRACGGVPSRALYTDGGGIRPHQMAIALRRSGALSQLCVPHCNAHSLLHRSKDLNWMTPARYPLSEFLNWYGLTDQQDVTDRLSVKHTDNPSATSATKSVTNFA